MRERGRQWDGSGKRPQEHSCQWPREPPNQAGAVQKAQRVLEDGTDRMSSLEKIYTNGKQD